MGLALVSPLGQGYQLDAQTMRDVFHKFPRSPYLEGQIAVLYNFCGRTAPENAQEIDRLVGLAETTGLPLRIAFQMHWAGLPKTVSDGAGGTFGDLPYQQITFDPDDKVEDPGLAALLGDRYDVRFGLSVPNRWGDTPWLTFNHPRLNQLRRIRLTQALYAWREARERLLLAGKGRLLPPELSTGEETVYWAKGVDDGKYTAANGEKPRANLMADFNPFVAADAQRDGIDLDPRNGLDNKERWWLHQNLARQQQRIVDWMADALPAEPIRLTGTMTPSFASDLTRRNLFTEPYAMPLFPMKDVNPHRPGLEVGYVRNGRSGGEYWSGATMLPWLLKERERGRIALPNLECSGADDPQLTACLQAAYACGTRFITVYNWQQRPTAPQMLRAFADSIATPAGQEFPSTALGYGRKWERTYVAASNTFGVNRIQLYNQNHDTPLSVRVTLRDAVSARSEGMTVFAILPPSPASSLSDVILPTLFPQEPGKSYLLVVEAMDTPSAGVGLAADGKIACRLLADLRLERTRSLAIEDWQDAADILAGLRAYHARTTQSLFAREALEAAQQFFNNNQPQESYHAAIRAEQLALPAPYALPAPGGRLAPYWISILCPGGPVRATVLDYSAQSAIVSLKSATAQTITLRWGNLETRADLSPNIPAEITLVQKR